MRMFRKVTFFLLCLGLLGGLKATAQAKEDIAALGSLMDAPKAEHYPAPSFKGKNVVHKGFTVMFLVYKRYISSQDGSSCSFAPSCSEYALRSIQRKGIFIGVMAAFDRLTRCNGMNHDQYDPVPYSYRVSDPVE